MNILTTPQIKDLDAFTIKNEPIASIDLMERAAGTCYNFINSHFPHSEYVVFCGTGNNGGDGLAIARMLHEKNLNVRTYIVGNPKDGSNEFVTNFARLNELKDLQIEVLSEENNFAVFRNGEIVIDAILGIGLNGKTKGWRTKVIDLINSYENPVISIDIPSGLQSDLIDYQEGSIVRADLTLSFHSMKRAFVFAENESFCGDVELMDIGLMHEFLPVETNFEFITRNEMQSLVHWRQRFSHKGLYGHLLIVGGSYGRIGALVLSAKAALRMGVGLLTTYLPKCGYNIIQNSVPEAMCITDSDKKHIKNSIKFPHADAVGIGPGMGTFSDTVEFLEEFIEDALCPLVLDADALNIISNNPELLNALPYECILTPHPKEFDRLFGTHKSSFDRVKTLQLKAIEFNIIIILKGAYTRIAVPDGQVFINSTGNSGMSTGGSGDVLTGMISALLAQNYSPEEAAKLGVYLHGRSGDIAADHVGMTSLIASDIINFIPDAILELENASFI